MWLMMNSKQYEPLGPSVTYHLPLGMASPHFSEIFRVFEKAKQLLAATH